MGKKSEENMNKKNMWFKYFKNNGDTFSAIRLAENFLKEHGYSYGSMECSEPIGVAKGDVYIGKWTRIPIKERDNLDGTIESKDFRDGDVCIFLKQRPETYHWLDEVTEGET